MPQNTRAERARCLAVAAIMAGADRTLALGKLPWPGSPTTMGEAIDGGFDAIVADFLSTPEQPISPNEIAEHFAEARDKKIVGSVCREFIGKDGQHWKELTSGEVLAAEASNDD